MAWPSEEKEVDVVDPRQGWWERNKDWLLIPSQTDQDVLDGNQRQEDPWIQQGRI